MLNVTALGSITAQGRKLSSDPTGFVFEGGAVIGSTNGDSLLGRGYRPCSRVIFYKSNLGGVVSPVGWDAWNGKDDVYDPSITYHSYMSFIFYLLLWTNLCTSCLFYSEIECTGPGSDTSQRVSWEKNLTATQFVQNFSMQVFINQDGWLSNIPQQSQSHLLV